MEYNIFRGEYGDGIQYKCPNCGTEQKHLNLEETEGSFICSKCNKQTRVDLEAIKKESLKKETAN